MRRFIGLTALMLVASAARAQDTTVVVVRHLPAQQDTTVTVRHIAPAQAPLVAQRTPPPYGAPRYGARSSTVFAKDPNLGTTFSFIFPGGGQYYAGAESKGLMITALAIGAPIIGYANVTRNNFYYNGTGPAPAPGTNCYVNPGGPNVPAGSQPPGGAFCRGSYNWAPAAIGLGVGITAWLYGIATAGSDVQHWNQSHGVRFVSGPGRVGFAVAVP